MLEDLDIEYKDMVEKALEGFRRDIEEITATRGVTLLAPKEPPPLGALTLEEIEKLKKEKK